MRKGIESYLCVYYTCSRLVGFESPSSVYTDGDQILASGQTAMSEQERCSWVSYVLYDPARPRFCSIAKLFGEVCTPLANLENLASH